MASIRRCVAGLARFSRAAWLGWRVAPLGCLTLALTNSASRLCLGFCFIGNEEKMVRHPDDTLGSGW